MALRMYSLESFDYQKVIEGALCVVVASDYQESSIMSTNPSLKAMGICTMINNRFDLKYNGQTWHITLEGGCINDPDVTVYIIRSSTPIADGSGSKPVTGDFVIDEDEEEGGESGESGEGSTTTDPESGSTETGSTDTTTDLTSSSKALIDEFAIVMLQAILSKVDRNITGISENEMDYYCDTAYKWAVCMMASRTDALS